MMLELDSMVNEGYEILNEHNEDLFVIKSFYQSDDCENIVTTAHELMKTLPNRKVEGGVQYSFDVLPTATQTDRIFRTVEFMEGEVSFKLDCISKLFDKMKSFQQKYVVQYTHGQNNMIRRCQLIHYPRGGGFFDWHQHPRYPVNYGLILNLSRKGVNFNSGATQIKRDTGEVICIEDFTDIGDLVLFKYDLEHRVAPCDPEDDLTFDNNGRWTAIMPIY